MAARWTFLGHASWLADTGGVRVVMDPVLGPTCHDGVFEVVPARTIDPAGLAADVVVVTHVHPDHFDVPTLKVLAGRAKRLITADPLVEETARALGFARVDRVGADEVIRLGGTDWATTRSWCDVEEWGLLAASDEGTVWNQVDTAVRDPVTVRGMFGRAAGALGRPELARGPDVAVVRWCPLLQADGLCSGSLGFPYQAYGGELRNAASTGARTLLPGSCGDRYTGAGAWQNACVYPVTSARFARDLAELAPAAEVRIPEVGQTFALNAGRFELDGRAPWITVQGSAEPPVFAPFELPPIVDPAPPGFDADRALLRIAVWITDVVAPAVGVWAKRAGLQRLSACLEVVLPERTVGFTLRVADGRVEVTVGSDPDHDALERIAGSVWIDVLDGRSAWGRALLGGTMRSVRRVYRIGTGGTVHPVEIPAFLVYLGLSWEESTRRWIRFQLASGEGVR